MIMLFQAQNPKLMKPSIINAFLIPFLADFIKYTKTKITAKFELFIIFQVVILSSEVVILVQVPHMIYPISEIITTVFYKAKQL